MKNILKLFLLITGFLQFNTIAYSQLLATCSSVGTPNNISYTVQVRPNSAIDTNLFNNAYSRVSIFATPAAGTAPPAFVSLSNNIINDEHVQKSFERSPRQPAGQPAILFDIYFPKLRGMNNLLFTIYPNGTDATRLNDNTPGFGCSVPVITTREASALLLQQENKENNVRVFKVANAVPGNPPANQSVEYFWTGRDLQNPNTTIVGAIAHVTEESNTFLLKSLSLQQRINTQPGGNSINSPLDVFFDPSNNNKAHLYLSTDPTGFARLIVSPKNTPAGGHLIYFPFADTTSEAARIIVYDPNILAQGFFEPIPVKNPISISSDKACDVPTWNIKNNDGKITENGRIYLLINENYDNSMFSSNRTTITMNSSNRFINTSELPEPNQARYIFLSETGTVNLSRNYTFFAFPGVASSITRLDNTVLNFCDIKRSTLRQFDSQLLPSNEVPPLAGSNAFGRIVANYNATDKLLKWNVTYQGFTSDVVQAHFHGPADVNANADVIIDIPTDSLPSPISGSQTLTLEQEQQLLDGLWYFNIHTRTNQGGELRGQLIPR